MLRPGVSLAALAIALLCWGSAPVAASMCLEQTLGPYDQGYADSTADLVQGQCKRCSADNTTCTKCWCGYSLGSSGACIECADSLCCDCDPANPGFCLKCLESGWEGDECYYNDGKGSCLKCPVEDCQKADNDGACQKCSTGYGLRPDGSCKSCSDYSCTRCDGDGKACQECQDQSFLDASSSTCKTCPQNCWKCSDGECTECLGGYTLNSTGNCMPCSSKGCIACKKDAAACEECDSGFSLLNATATCVECQHEGQCQRCDASGACIECSAGFAVTAGGQCVDCNTEKCESCKAEGNATVCTECSVGYYLADAAAGTCKRCPTHCTQCSDATTCLKCDTSHQHYDVWDNDGTVDTYDTAVGVALQNGTCVACALPGCSRCPDGPQTCERCLWWLGWTMTDQGCVRCSDPSCRQCAMAPMAPSLAMTAWKVTCRIQATRRASPKSPTAPATLASTAPGCATTARMGGCWTATPPHAWPAPSSTAALPSHAGKAVLLGL